MSNNKLVLVSVKVLPIHLLIFSQVSVVKRLKNKRVQVQILRMSSRNLSSSSLWEAKVRNNRVKQRVVQGLVQAPRMQEKPREKTYTLILILTLWRQ